MRLRDRLERSDFGYSGIGEQDIDPAEFLFDLDGNCPGLVIAV